MLHLTLNGPHRIISHYIELPLSSSASVLTDPNTEIVISSAAFVDSNGNNKVLHISDFSNYDNPETSTMN